MDAPLKIGILVSHPIQYFVPIYQKLAKTPGIDVTVLYRSRLGVDAYHDPGFGRSVQWDIPLLDAYAHQFLSRKNSLQGVCWSVVAVLLRKRFDVLLVHGYDNLTNLLAILVAKLSGTRVLMRGDTRALSHHKGNVIKALFKRALFKFCDGCVAIGSLNSAYYSEHGVPPARVFFAPFCVRNELFAVSPEMRQRCRQEVRDELCFERNSLIVLFASKLIRRKRADDLIVAFARLAHAFPMAYLVIVGSGDEKANLCALADASGGQRIRFMGFKNQSQLPHIYAASDVFVLPADAEPWGLVVNEVMAAGIPVVVSDEVGAAPDLVEHRGTGVVFPCGDIDELAASICRLLGDQRLREGMSSNAVNLIRGWDVDECAIGIINAALSVTGRK